MARATEFRFKIDAYTPETIPMARLAEYMAQVAILLGETANVHFVRLEHGSVALVQLVEAEAVPKVRERVDRTNRGDGPPDAMAAFKSINRKLRDDNGVAVLSLEEGADIIRFPGRECVELLTFGAFNQPGSLDGVVIRLGGTREFVPVHIQSGAVVYSECRAHRNIAKQLAPHIFTTPLRVYGIGRWHRDEIGTWVLDNFNISHFEELRGDSLTSVVAALRAVPGSQWPTVSDPWSELNAIRNG